MIGGPPDRGGGASSQDSTCVMGAGVVDPLAGEEPPDDGERLDEPAGPVVVGEAECLELVAVPSGPDAEHEPAIGDLIERCGLLRQHGRVVERGRGHQGSDRHALRHRGDSGEDRPRLPRTRDAPIGISIQQMVADPHRVEPDCLGGRGDVLELGPPHHPFHLGELHSDTHGRVRPSCRRLPIVDRAAPRRGAALAEGVGFEPTEACASLVFKTSTFVRSVIPPGRALGARRRTQYVVRRTGRSLDSGVPTPRLRSGPFRRAASPSGR